MMQELPYIRPTNLPDEIIIKALDGHDYSHPKISEDKRLANRKKRQKLVKASKRSK